MSAISGKDTTLWLVAVLNTKENREVRVESRATRNSMVENPVMVAKDPKVVTRDPDMKKKAISVKSNREQRKGAEKVESEP